MTTPGVESDDAEAANETFIDARGAEVLDVPTERVTSTIVVPVYPALDESLSDRLGTPLPVLVSVQNGSGRPGVGEEVAERYYAAVISTLRELSLQPGLGRRRQFRHPELKGLRSFRLRRPYGVHLIFYRHTDSELFAERIMHGARNLPRRLLEPPAEG